MANMQSLSYVTADLVVGSIMAGNCQMAILQMRQDVHPSLRAGDLLSRTIQSFNTLSLSLAALQHNGDPQERRWS